MAHRTHEVKPSAEEWAKVIALINKGWTQHTYARDLDGNTAMPVSPQACTWCVDGAFFHVAYTDERAVRYGLQWQLYFAFSKDCQAALYKYLNNPLAPHYVEWQDDAERTAEDVVNLLTFILEEVQAEESQREIEDEKESDRQNLLAPI